VIWVNGRIVTSNMVEMMVHDPEGGNSTKLRSYSSIYRELARCGPGQVAYWAADGEHQSHIARTDIVTGSTSRLTDGPLDGEPTCTADGSTLFFFHCAHQSNRCILTRKSIDSGQSLVLYECAEDNGMTSPNPTLSPDGTNVLFRQFRQERDAKNPYEWAMVVPTAGGNPRKLKMPVSTGEDSLGFSRCEVLGGKFRSLTYGFEHAALIGDGSACYVKGGPVIDGGAHDGQAYGDVHA
jgi:hypothetical protein